MSENRRIGQKAKRQILMDTTEKQRKYKAQNKNRCQEVISSSSDEEIEWCHEPEVVLKKTTGRRQNSKQAHTTPKSRQHQSNDDLNNMPFSAVLENFGELFHAALADPRTTETMTKVFTPLMIQQTSEITNEIRDLKKEVKAQRHKIDRVAQKIDQLELNDDQLKQDIETMSETVNQQQRYLETIDYERRKNHLVITGLAEDSPLIDEQGQAAVTDQEKVNTIFNHIGYEHIEFNELRRLGEKPRNRNTTYKRPLKVRVNSNLRPEILTKSKKLKESNGDLSKVFIRKDTHPGILKEQKRIKDVVKQEKEKPENIGKNVQYNWKERTVTVDDVIIDNFNPTFF